jgi:hypothetical protein
MKTKIILSAVVLFAVSIACSGLSLNAKTPPEASATKLVNPNSELPTPSSANCDPNKWKIAITSIDQKDLGDGTKLIIASIGIENNDSLWGSISGPEDYDKHNDETQYDVFLTTKDGSNFGYLGGNLPIPTEQLSTQNLVGYGSTGSIGTLLLPPGFVTLGLMMGGKPNYFNFAFTIPNSQTPNSITIGGFQVSCIVPPTMEVWSVKPVYHGKTIDLPVKTYNLTTNIADIHGEPSFTSNYPNLVGSKLDLPDDNGIIEFTGVTRNGNTINILFNFTNLSSTETAPYFNKTGYIIGDSRLFSVQTDVENYRDPQSFYTPVQPGQTMQGFIWSFTVPENEINLMFVFVYGDVIDVNKVYRITPN